MYPNGCKNRDLVLSPRHVSKEIFKMESSLVSLMRRWYSSVSFSLLILSVIFVVVSILILASCSGHAVNPDFEGVSYSVAGYSVVRFVDVKAGVVCYKIGGGVSCLPISQTRLGR